MLNDSNFFSRAKNNKIPCFPCIPCAIKSYNVLEKDQLCLTAGDQRNVLEENQLCLTAKERRNVLEEGQLCLTAGDRREPAEQRIYSHPVPNGGEPINKLFKLNTNPIKKPYNYD